jgi:hypothetical protein
MKAMNSSRLTAYHFVYKRPQSYMTNDINCDTPIRRQHSYLENPQPERVSENITTKVRHQFDVRLPSLL